MIQRAAHNALPTLALIWILVVMAACTPPTPTRTPPPTPVPIITMIVTRTPRPTETPVPTPTLPYDINAVFGNWTLDLTYQMRDNQLFDDVRFVGTAGLVVSDTGTVSGSVEFYAAVQQIPCVSAVLDDEPLRATVSGTLRPAEAGGVIADLTLTPSDPLRVTALSLVCPGDAAVFERRTPIFWPALAATDSLSFAVPLRSGYQATHIADLNGPTAGGLRGILITQVRMGR